MAAHRARCGPWSVVGMLLVGLAACGGEDEPVVTEPGLANPASVYCIEQGGRLEIVDEADGQVGYCLLPDGSRVEEWEYYRSRTQP